MPSDEFWNLTWYDWGLWIERIREERERRLQDKELIVEMTRSFMALFANANRGKAQKTFEPKDFFKLSYDDRNQTGELSEDDIKAIEEKSRQTFERLTTRHNKKRNG